MIDKKINEILDGRSEATYFFDRFLYYEEKIRAGGYNRDVIFQEVLSLAQYQLHSLVNLFLNLPYYSGKALLFHPIEIGKFDLGSWKVYLNKIIFLLEEIEQRSCFCQTQKVLLRTPDKCSSKEIANLLSVSYIDFAAEKLQHLCSYQRKVVRLKQRFLVKFYETQDGGYLVPIARLNNFIKKEMPNFIYGAYLHGSMATMDYTKYSSDVDTLIIIKDDVVFSSDNLLLLQNIWMESLRFAQLIDPFQHHGHIAITEMDLKHYSESHFLPLSTLSNATSFEGMPEKLVLHIKDENNKEKMDNLWNTIRALAAYARMRKFTSLYHIKGINHTILLLPVAYLHALDISVYKRDSFRIAKNLLPKGSWEVIENSTKIRETWNYNYRAFEKVLFKFPNPMSITLWHRFASRLITRKMSQYPWNEILSESLKLGAELLQNVLDRRRDA